MFADRGQRGSIWPWGPGDLADWGEGQGHLCDSYSRGVTLCRLSGSADSHVIATQHSPHRDHSVDSKCTAYYDPGIVSSNPALVMVFPMCLFCISLPPCCDLPFFKNSNMLEYWICVIKANPVKNIYGDCIHTGMILHVGPLTLYWESRQMVSHVNGITGVRVQFPL